MHKVLYSVITKIPIIGPIYESIARPKFSSMGLSDGEYDLALSLIEKYQKKQPNEQITLKLIKKLMEDENKNC